MATPKTIPSVINTGNIDRTSAGDYIYITAVLVNIGSLNIDDAGAQSVGPISLGASPIKCQKFTGSAGGDIAYFIKTN